MGKSSRKPLQVDGGATLVQIYRWGAEPIVYKPVSAVLSLTPLTVTATTHGVVNGWSVALNDFAAPLDPLNSDQWTPDCDDFVQATVVDSSTLAFNKVDAAHLGAYTTGGTVAYYTPVSLAGVTGVFNVYTSPAATSGPQTPFLSVAAVLDNTAKTITATLTSAQTATLTDPSYTFAMIVTDAGGNVTVLAEGSLSVKFPGG